jgi:hypothetical protein
MMTATATAYRIVSHRDSRGGRWFDVETIAANGGRLFVASLDTREEARELVRQLEAHAARLPFAR